MKKALAIVLVCMMVILAACGGSEKAGKAGNDFDKTNPHDLAKKILDTMGKDLIQKAKDAGFTLKMNFKNYTPVASREELKGAPAVLTISVYLTSAAGSANPDNFTLDVELMKQLQYAILDANVFDLTADEINTLKSDWFQKDDVEGIIDIEQKHVRMKIERLGSGKNRYANLAVMHWGHVPDFYNDSWYVTYNWDEITESTRKEN